MHYPCFTTLLILWIPLFDCSISRFHFKKQRQNSTHKFSQFIYNAQVTTSAKTYDNFSEIKHGNPQSNEFRKKTLDLIKQIGDLIEAYPANNSEHLTLKLWRKFSLKTTLHYSPSQFRKWVWKPCNILLIKCSLLSHYWNKL